LETTQNGLEGRKQPKTSPSDTNTGSNSDDQEKNTEKNLLTQLQQRE